MRRLVSTILGVPVTAKGSDTPIGKATDVWFDRRTGVLAAIRVQKGMLFPHEHFVLPREILSWEPSITVKSGSALVEKSGVAAGTAQPWMHLPVKMCNGTGIGSIADLEFESELLAVQRLHIDGRLMGPPRIVEASLIYEVTEEAVILLDDVERRAAPRGVVERLVKAAQGPAQDPVPNV